MRVHPEILEYPRLDYDLWARTVSPDDLWRQVRRTVAGQPVPDVDIDLIVGTIRDQLALINNDNVLDLACGNGALASRFFTRCHGYLGSDLSPYLIGIAQRRFAITGRVAFIVSGAGQHVRQEPEPARFTKALCYGSFAYFDDDEAALVLNGLFQRFPNISRCFVGNLPDRNSASAFYRGDLPSEAELGDPQSRIGVWRSRETFQNLAEAAGWRVTFSTMPECFFAAHYRFDALLERS